MEIRKYEKRDEDTLMALIQEQGEEWADYWGPEGSGKYRLSLSRSITYVACDNEKVCGYARSLEDHGFCLYVCDLLVAPRFRGQDIGRQLMESLRREHPGQTVYVMSDVDGYYIKLGYKKAGSVFEVCQPPA